jgi:NAD+ kinase
MQINECLVVVKKTALAQGGRAEQFARKGDATAIRLLRADAEHQRTVEEVRKTLSRLKIPFLETSLGALNKTLKKRLAQADFVISIGGDGTALGASHYVRDGLMLGVNSAPGDSVGHFCRAHRKNFGEKLKSILSRDWLPTELARLQITLDETPLPELALNDLLVAHDCPASTTRYLIEVGDAREEHRSSGVWISTAAGSTAGILSAGGKILPLRSQRIQYLIRELYREPNRSYQLIRGFISPPHEIVIASKMPDGHLYVDGARTHYPFVFGMRARIRLADERLQLLL